jgi:dTDP-4-amino-4,6-dideoxygalactose transaminase
MSGLKERRIAVADPRGDLAELRDRIVDAVVDVIDSGSYILGKQVATFEDALAARLRTPGTVGVGSGTDALVLALTALGISSGDEVITVSHTAGPTVAAIRMLGALPVFVEVTEDTYCMDAQALDAAVGPRTKAILTVHIYGHPADLTAIGAVARRHSVPVIEDCAQAQDAAIDGRSVGTIGEAGCFSFYPTKTLGGLGDGGLVTSTNRNLIDRMRVLRTYGWTRPQFSEIAGGRCSRLDELQAAILRVKLDRLTQDVERRRQLAQRYNAGLAGLPLILPHEKSGCHHVYHLYVVRSDRREALARHLDRAGISTAIHYPFPVHVQPGLAAGARIPQPLSVTERLAGEILTLPLYPSMSDADQSRVVEGVSSFFKS